MFISRLLVRSTNFSNKESYASPRPVHVETGWFSLSRVVCYRIDMRLRRIIAFTFELLDGALGEKNERDDVRAGGGGGTLLLAPLDRLLAQLGSGVFLLRSCTIRRFVWRSSLEGQWAQSLRRPCTQRIAAAEDGPKYYEK